MVQPIVDMNTSQESVESLADTPVLQLPTPGRGRGRKKKVVVEQESKDEPPVPVPKLLNDEPASQASGKKGKKANRSENKDVQLYKMLLEEIEKDENSWPFMNPVNLKQFPTYKKIIKKPMDFSIIRSRSESGV